MRIFKRILVPVMFIAVLFAINTYLNYLLVPYTFTRYKVHKIETGTFDDLILGSSHAGTCLAPSSISTVTGRSAFNAARMRSLPWRARIVSYSSHRSAIVSPARPPLRLIAASCACFCCATVSAAVVSFAYDTIIPTCAPIANSWKNQSFTSLARFKNIIPF